jgi:hypothetical protein
MPYLPHSTYLANHRVVFGPKPHLNAPYTAAKHKARIKSELKDLGVTSWGMLYAESRYLHLIIHDHERLEAIVYGHYADGTGMLTATDKRVIFLDKKPLFIRTDELTYDVVSGVSYNQMGLIATVTLHTRLGDYTLRTMNLKCAQHFRNFIESHCLEQTYSKESKFD